MLNDFYVDDCLTSVDKDTDAIDLTKTLTRLCQLGGFHLHKWLSSSPTVLATIPEAERAQCCEASLDGATPLMERALGVRWNVSSDCISFKINVRDQPTSRRGILSIVSSVYDPLGIAAPAMLPAKHLLQELCEKGCSWDQTVSDTYAKQWTQWMQQLPLLESLEMPRCIKPPTFGHVISTQLHHFSDASNKGYGVQATCGSSTTQA